MATVKDSDELAVKLESYVEQLRQVEAALKIDPAHVDLLTIQADLKELISLTKKKISDGTGTSASSFKRAKSSSSSEDQEDTSTCYKRTTTESTSSTSFDPQSAIPASEPAPERFCHNCRKMGHHIHRDCPNERVRCRKNQKTRRANKKSKIRI